MTDGPHGAGKFKDRRRSNLTVNGRKLFLMLPVWPRLGAF